MAPGLDQGQDLLLQVFADDISAAVKCQSTSEAVEMVNKLAEALLRVLHATGLRLSRRKCKNFLIQSLRGVLRLFGRANPTSKWQRAKGKTRQNAAKSLRQEQLQTEETQAHQLPYELVGSFKLLGLTLDNA